MLPIMPKFIGSLLLSAASFANPTTPKALSFDASAFVTNNHEIRVAVSKATDTPVAVILRDKSNQILFQRTIAKKAPSYAIKMNVDDLADGAYDLEIKSDAGSIHKQVTLTTPVKVTDRSVVMQ